MKVIDWPIEVIAWFDGKGVPTPLRIRLKNTDESYQIVKVNKIIQVNRERIAGNSMYVFKCQSVIDNMERMYEIKYELSSCKWTLFKM